MIVTSWRTYITSVHLPGVMMWVAIGYISRSPNVRTDGILNNGSCISGVLSTFYGSLTNRNVRSMVAKRLAYPQMTIATADELWHRAEPSPLSSRRC
ncbi:hypothetical protein TNCV_444061 [Trichonephila clavipes]|nr:hypothetical protein TNCV_444061 [Trichonephila clavipes]